MPKDFQTSQYDEPIAAEGSVEIELEDGTPFTIPIERAHMEEDAGKNTHVGGATGRIHGADHSLVDYNRAGVPLVEIVTHPITGTGERAAEVAAPTSAPCATSSVPSASPRRRWSRATSAPTSTSPSGEPRRSAGHAHGDEERQLVPLDRTRRALRDRPPGDRPRSR